MNKREIFDEYKTIPSKDNCDNCKNIKQGRKFCKI